MRYVVALLIVQMDTLCTCIVKSVMVSQSIALKESIHSNDILPRYHYAAVFNIYTWEKKKNPKQIAELRGQRTDELSYR